MINFTSGNQNFTFLCFEEIIFLDIDMEFLFSTLTKEKNKMQKLRKSYPNTHRAILRAPLVSEDTVSE